MRVVRCRQIVPFLHCWFVGVSSCGLCVVGRRFKIYLRAVVMSRNFTSMIMFWCSALSVFTCLSILVDHTSRDLASVTDWWCGKGSVPSEDVAELLKILSCNVHDSYG